MAEAGFHDSWLLDGFFFSIINEEESKHIPLLNKDSLCVFVCDQVFVLGCIMFPRVYWDWWRNWCRASLQSQIATEGFD